MEVRAIMKEDPRCIRADATLKEAAMLMEQVDCGVLPVLRDAESAAPVGVLTDRDIVLRCVAEGRDCETTRVQDVYTTSPVTCAADCSVADAFEQMRTEKVGRLLVTDNQDNLIGIVTMADIITRTPREIWSQLPGAERPQPRRAA